MEQEQQRYERARERVKELKGFYTHVAIYVLVNIGLFIINLLAGGVWWFYWPLVGWGIGLLVHAINVFGFGGRLGRDWEERKTRELMDKERQSFGILLLALFGLIFFRNRMLLVAW